MKKDISIVLIHPFLGNSIEAATPDYVDKNRGHNPPLGLLYLASAIEKTNHQVNFIDANLDNLNHRQTALKAISLSPDVIGIQAMTFTFRDAYLLAKEIKSLNGNIVIIVGGPHPTLYPKETVMHECFDYAIVGEGEISIVEFLDSFYDKNKREKINGLATLINGKFNYSSTNKYIDNIDKVDFPARSISKYTEYSSVLATKNPITTMITSRGCPFDCVFCNRMGRRYRYHSSNYVLNEIEHIISLGIKEIFIHDDTFTLNRKRVIEICNGIIERGYEIVWDARTRVDCVDKELLALMKKAGCHRLSFGVESGSEKVLKSMRKKIDIKQVIKIFKYCKKIGIVTLADFMFGNMDEKIDDINQTISFMKKLKPDYAQFSICSAYPGTPLYEIALEKGIIKDDVWREFAKNPLEYFKAPVWTAEFTEEELVKITNKAYKTFYFNPIKILRLLITINSWSKLKTMLLGAFGMFFPLKKSLTFKNL